MSLTVGQMIARAKGFGNISYWEDAACEIEELLKHKHPGTEISFVGWSENSFGTMSERATSLGWCILAGSLENTEAYGVYEKDWSGLTPRDQRALSYMSDLMADILESGYNKLYSAELNRQNGPYHQFGEIRGKMGEWISEYRDRNLPQCEMILGKIACAALVNLRDFVQDTDSLARVAGSVIWDTPDWLCYETEPALDELIDNRVEGFRDRGLEPISDSVGPRRVKVHPTVMEAAVASVKLDKGDGQTVILPPDKTHPPIPLSDLAPNYVDPLVGSSSIEGAEDEWC